MKCQLCSKPATIHFTKIVNKEKTEVHLCEACAQKQHFISPNDMSLSAILQSLIGHHVGGQTEQLARLTCPTCGIKYMQFRAEGRLGCPADYDVFRAGLEPILERVHRSIRHVGKVPRRGRAQTLGETDLLALRQQLRQAVDREDYEVAAQLRDLIRHKEFDG